MSHPPAGHISYGQPPRKDGLGPSFRSSAAARRQPLDWITEFAIPIGVIGLLSSFLYYLIELRALTGGTAAGALKWVCFFFLLGTVFVTRVRTKYGESAIAAPYIIGLAAAIGLFIWQFTMWSGSLTGQRMGGGRLIDLLFNYAIVGLIWYAAGRLTRECTAEETTERAGEEGLLSEITAGRERQRARPIGDRQAPKHPGWLVMWFSLVAVAIFALGQRAMIAVRGESTPFAFKCLAAYMFFALALLALTSLSALRMQVRRRKIGLSASVAPAWIWLSAMAICAILAVASFLPRRDTGAKVEPGSRIASVPGEAEGEGLDAPVEGQRPLEEQDRAGEGGEEGAAGGAQAGTKGAGEREGEGAGRQQGGVGEGAGGAGEAGGAAGSTGEGAGMGEGAGEQPPAPRRDWLWLLKLVIAILLALLALYVLYRLARAFIAWLRKTTGWKLRMPPIVAAVLQRLQALLARLLYLLRLRRLGGVVAAEAQGIDRQTLADPFSDRSLTGKSSAEKVKHVYRAMLAYAELLECPRAPEQTPLEYLRKLPASLAPISKEAHTLTLYFVQASYSPKDITDAQVHSLRGIWARLQARIDSALAQERQSSVVGG